MTALIGGIAQMLPQILQAFGGGGNSADTAMDKAGNDILPDLKDNGGRNGNKNLL